MKKKGLLLATKTIEIIIAVICMLFLAYIIYSVYSTKVNNENKKLAEGTLTRTQEIISSLEEGKSFTQDLVNPKGWYLMSFTEGNIKPNTCIGKNCLCLCSRKTNPVKQAKECDDAGACIIVENLNGFQKIKIIGPDQIKLIKIKKQSGFILIGV